MEDAWRRAGRRKGEKMESREYRIQVIRHRHSDLLMAISPDHKGINVAARSEAELKNELAAVLQAMLEAQGNHVVRVEVIEVEDAPVDEFEVNNLIANAQLAA